MKKTRISVKELVTFIHRGGDLTSEFKSNARAKQGTECHAYLQDKYLESDQKEVFVKHSITQSHHQLTISGRIDGVLLRDKLTIIEEIKSTTISLDLMHDTTRPEHLAQAKLYAYMYLLDQKQKAITVHLTYIHVSTYETKVIKKRYNQTQLKRFFDDTILQYMTWFELFEAHQENRNQSIEGLKFPFDDYREGQYQFMGAIYQNFIQQSILYSVAPTGIGKTVAALYSSLKTLDKKSDKLFYLTAKNQGKTIVIDTLNLLKEKGLKCKSVVLHSKESMCLMDTVDCDPDICPYAKGYFEREKEALSDIFVHDDVYDRHLIRQYGEYHTICPHEFSLSIASVSDVVVCDYNYAFDPRVHLIRFFEENFYTPKLLIDEAHNMVDRSKMMYSASLHQSSLKRLKKALKGFDQILHAAVGAVLKIITAYQDKHGLDKAPFYYQLDNDFALLDAIDFALIQLEKHLVEHKKFKARKEVLDVYFELLQYRRISDFYDRHYRLFIELVGSDIVVTQKCFNAAHYIEETIENHTQGAVLFSATLEPIDYYVDLITNKNGQTISIPSPFDPKKLGLFIEARTSTRYRDRDRSIIPIIDAILAMVEAKKGNYIVFFPSYYYMEQVLDAFDTSGYKVLVQTKNMSYTERQGLLDTFSDTHDQSTIGFFVLGGSFSEGIDYVGDLLHGVLIVGVAFPMFNKENQLLQSYFDEAGYDGFNYAFTYPGMNKVIQAVGRVIRTEEDRGVAILFDDRYLHRVYQDLFPSHWIHVHTLRPGTFLLDALSDFWTKKNTSK